MEALEEGSNNQNSWVKHCLQTSCKGDPRIMETWLGVWDHWFWERILPCLSSITKDYYHILNGGLWMVLGNYLTIAKWRPNFYPSQDKITSILVRVLFSKILIEIFHENFLLRMGNLVGRAIRADPTNLSTARGKFSRVCVESNFQKPLVPLVSAMVHMVSVFFLSFSFPFMFCCFFLDLYFLLFTLFLPLFVSFLCFVVVWGWILDFLTRFIIARLLPIYVFFFFFY